MHYKTESRSLPAFCHSVLCAYIVIALTGCGKVTAANVLTNAGFESDASGQVQFMGGWIANANSYGESGSSARTGNNYLKIYGQFNGTNNYSGIYQDIPAVAGATYKADGWTYSLASDGGGIHGQDLIWLEVTFRDSGNNVLSLYRSDIINGTNIANYGGLNTWFDLGITNQCSFTNNGALFILPVAVTNHASSLVAPAGTASVRYQIIFAQGPDNANGSMYFDDCTLNQISGPATNLAWNLVWSDEFNGTSINTSIWTFEFGNNNGWGNSELESYTNSPQNAYVSNGLLHIVARQQTSNTYTSARMKTEGLYSKTYGRFEFRMKLPQGVGFWPAAWMLGNSISSIGWPNCGEIDVMENAGGNLSQVQGSLHSGSDETQVYTLPNGGSVTNFHVYRLDWLPDSLTFYVDDVPYETQTGWYDAGGAYPTPFNTPFFIILNLAVGGKYVGNPSTTNINANSVFPGDMQVDYVRVYDLTPPMQISATHTNALLKLTWPTNIVCHLQVQTNLAGGIATNWVDLAVTSSPYQVPVSSTSRSVFYRLVSP